MKAMPAAHKNTILILRSRAQRGVSKDVANRSRVYPEIGTISAQVGYSRLAMFETRRFTALLTMRVTGMWN